jgi:hypothetical protein
MDTASDSLPDEAYLPVGYHELMTGPAVSRLSPQSSESNPDRGASLYDEDDIEELKRTVYLLKKQVACLIREKDHLENQYKLALTRIKQLEGH